MRKQPRFNPDRFTATPWTPVADKAKFAEALADFVESGFEERRWTKPLYDRLRNCFGHIAEYDSGGFWSVWFASPTERLCWIDHVLAHRPVGPVDATFSDVERDFIDWLTARPELRERERRIAADTAKASDLALLRRFVNQYPEEARALVAGVEAPEQEGEEQ